MPDDLLATMLATMVRPGFAGVVALVVGCSQPAHPPVLAYPDPDVPEYVPMYVPPDAVPITPPQQTCGGDAVTFTRTQSEVILLIDRSGSMVEATTDGTPKWTALQRALQGVLPHIEANISLGMLAFPRPQPGGASTPDIFCGVMPSLDVQPSLNTATAILAAVMRYPPSGATPTYLALAAASQYYSTEPDRSGNHYLILATDGGPNCNPSMDPHVCRCSDAAAQCNPMTNAIAAYNCLDDTRTINQISTLNLMGVQTYVIGLPGSEDLRDVLNRMAVAGGRPRDGADRYYNVQSTTELASQFAAIATGLVECTFHLASQPPDPTLVDLRFNGASIVHDPSHNDGWDWTDSAHMSVDFYGPTCTRLRYASGGDRISAVFGCPAPAPP